MKQVAEGESEDQRHGSFNGVAVQIRSACLPIAWTRRDSPFSGVTIRALLSGVSCFRKAGICGFARWPGLKGRAAAAVRLDLGQSTEQKRKMKSLSRIKVEEDGYCPALFYAPCAYQSASKGRQCPPAATPAPPPRTTTRAPGSLPAGRSNTRPTHPASSHRAHRGSARRPLTARRPGSYGDWREAAHDGAGAAVLPAAVSRRSRCRESNRPQRCKRRVGAPTQRMMISRRPSEKRPTRPGKSRTNASHAR